jgi:hypothetical protein
VGVLDCLTTWLRHAGDYPTQRRVVALAWGSQFFNGEQMLHLTVEAYNLLYRLNPLRIAVQLGIAAIDDFACA